MAGRKPIYDVDGLNIGEKLEIKAKMKKFAHQIAYACGKRYNKNRLFKAEFEGGHVYIVREL